MNIEKELIQDRLNDMERDLFEEREIKNIRLVEKEELVNLGGITLVIDESHIKVIKCPAHIEKLFLFREKSGVWKAFSDEYDYVAQVKDRILLLNNMKVGNKYNLHDVAAGPVALWGIRDTEKINLYNSVYMQDYFQSNEEELVECFVCKDNDVLLRIRNMEVKSIGLRASHKHENALEMIMDPEVEAVDFWCSVKSGELIVIHNSLLARTMKSEGDLAVFDDTTGKYYYKLIFDRDKPADETFQNAYVRIHMGNLKNKLIFLENEEQY